MGPAPSGGGMGGSVPKVTPPTVRVPGAGKVDIARPEVGDGKKKKVITQKEYNEKYTNKFNELRGKKPDDELKKAILDALDGKYVVGNKADLILPPDVKTPAQIKDFLQKKLEAEQKQAAADAAAKADAAKAAWKPHDDKAAERNRPPPVVKEDPISIAEYGRRQRVNKGLEDPRPSDIGAPWFQDPR